LPLHTVIVVAEMYTIVENVKREPAGKNCLTKLIPNIFKKEKRSVF